MSADALQFLVNSTASTVVACAAVWWFLFRRELDPGSELALDVHFAGPQDNQILLEVIATLANKSTVQQRYEDFQVKVRYLRESDKVIDGPEWLNYQLLFPNTIDTRIQDGQEQKRRRLFGYSIYVNPKLTYRHSYITSIPDDATFIWVHCGMLFQTRERWYSIKPAKHVKNQQRLFKVPDSSSATRLSDCLRAPT